MFKYCLILISKSSREQYKYHYINITSYNIKDMIERNKYRFDAIIKIIYVKI